MHSFPEDLPYQKISEIFYSCSSSYAEFCSNVLDEAGAANSSLESEQIERKRKIDVSTIKTLNCTTKLLL